MNNITTFCWITHVPRGADGLALVPMRLDLEANPVAIPVVASLQ
jgi:hypothetical protein